VRLRDIEIPEDSLVKMPWQAEEIVKRLVESGDGDRPSRPGPAGAPPTRKPKRKARVLAHASLLEEPNVAPAAGESGDGPEEEETPLFRSDVRMVTLSAAVYDSEGRPLVGLGKDDFTVIEEGQIQKIDSAQSEEAPFNLVILLDLSASTRHGREDMKEIAEGFVRITRPQDKVAVYALFNNWFSVITPLTDDVGAALVQIDTIPKLTGATPLYDAIALAWDEELAELKGQRNAMIVITDGQDNRFAGTGVPSKVSDDELAEAAKHMETLIYPIFLGEPVDTYDKNSWGMKAYERLKKIAAASGGRVFEVGLEQDRVMLYGQVADELRSVYSVAFYPDNQDFSGDFREVDILVNRVGATVRARDGYYAEW
jgi:VWFA-related protein